LARILVIDDEPQVRNLLERLLTREGYEVVCAGDGDEGLKAYREAPADVVITDIVMPEREGIGFILELRREFPDAKVIAISGGGRIGPESYLPVAERLGAMRSFAKPLDRAGLLQAVQELLAT
jgi:DNA-binding NtrC family response regulator